MAHFLRHTGCPRCGSSDANALYSDGGSYCFSCGKPKGATISPYVMEEEPPKQIALPNDITKEFHKDAVEWITKYIPLELALANDIYYSAQRHQVIFAFYGANRDLLAYQARNLIPTKPGKRYFTQGDINAVVPIYFSATNSSGARNILCSDFLLAGGLDPVRDRFLVLVEDCLSAIKIAALGFDAMPLLGSGISREKLARLRPFYDVLAVFLDPNMFHKAVGLSKTAQLLGFKARVVKADADPKELSNKQLIELLT